MRLLLACVAGALALTGCSDWQDVAVAIDNDGPATSVDIVLTPERGETRTFHYDLAANGTETDAWSIRGGDLGYEVAIRAGSLEAHGREEFCASRAFLINVNATAVTYEHRRGDGWAGC